MIVYLMRHGQAEEHSPTGSDADRVLTQTGIEQARALSVYLLNKFSTEDKGDSVQVIASPYTRTRQTAAPIWEAFGHAENVDDRLAATSRVSSIVDVIEESATDSIAIISHNPIISRATDVLIAGPEAPRMFSMSPGQMIALRVNKAQVIGSGELFDRFRLGDD
ncbi:MAG: SixA phosphatase family protein [Phycisphaerales bacterium]